MPQVTIRRPLGELDLRNQLRFEPYTVFHLFLGQSPLGSLLLWQIGKRAIGLPLPHRNMVFEVLKGGLWEQSC
jgi:hypothetical protein